MQAAAQDLESFLLQHIDRLRNIPADEMAVKPSPYKWSKKEIMGHLIDSAQNNIRRFIIAQYEDSPQVVYNQDKWNAMNGYQQWVTEDIINLWYLLNKQICTILVNMPPGVKYRVCRTENVYTIEWLAIDYVKHLRHHVHQVLELEPVPYP